MTSLWKALKTTTMLLLMAGLVFASAVFTVLLYAKATGKLSVAVEAGVEENTQINSLDELSHRDQLDVNTEDQNQNNKKSHTIKASAHLEAPLILQYPELPRGCELTSLTMLFQYYGIDKSKTELLPELKRDTTPIAWKPGGGIAFWGHPNDGFVGDITLNSNGFGIYHEALFELLEQYIPSGIDLTGKDFSEVEAQVSQGIPVVVWTTTDNKVPDTWVEWDSPSGLVKTTYKEHAVLLVGYDEENVYINDPLRNQPNFAVPKTQFIESWEAMGKQALSYIEPNNEYE